MYSESPDFQVACVFATSCAMYFSATRRLNSLRLAWYCRPTVSRTAGFVICPMRASMSELYCVRRSRKFRTSMRPGSPAGRIMSVRNAVSIFPMSMAYLSDSTFTFIS